MLKELWAVFSGITQAWKIGCILTGGWWVHGSDAGTLATWTRVKDNPGKALSEEMALSDGYNGLKELNLCAHGLSGRDQPIRSLLEALWYLGGSI